MKTLNYISLLGILVMLFACEGVITEEDISELEVRLLAPSDNAEISGNVVRFDWREVEGARSYQVQVATPNFGNPEQFLLDTEIDSLTTYELELNQGSYQWRIKAKNEGYETRFSRASFDVVLAENFSDNTVVLSSPANNLITNSVIQDLGWQELNGATLYRLQILDGETLLEEVTTTNTSQSYTFLEGSLSWQVRAENGSANTLYSSRSILVDITSPNIPALAAPIDESTITTQEVTFEWTREAIDGSSEFDVISIYRDMELTDLVESSEQASPYTTTLSNDTYYWVVQAFDEAGNQGEVSEIFSLTVDN